MSNEAKVGLVVIVALVIFVTTFLVVANVQLTGQTHRYRTYFSYIGGLDEGGIVRFGGRKAGTIQSLTPWSEDMTRTEVVFTLRVEIPLNRDSVATIASLNALGQNYLEIMPGSSQAARIEPGGTVPSAEALTFSDLTRKVAQVADTATDLMGQIDLKMTVVADDIHGLLANLQEISGQDNQRRIAGILESSNELLETQTPKIDRLTTQFSETLERVEVLVEEYRRLARTADETVANTNRTVNETREPLKASLDEIRTTLQEARTLVEDARAMMVMNEGNVTQIVENFRRASEDIAALSSELRQRPWTLIRARPKADREVPATGVLDSSGR